MRNSIPESIKPACSNLSETENQTGKVRSLIQKTGYRISLRGDGQILSPSGNPLNGWEKEKACKMLNEYDALVAVAEAVKKQRDEWKSCKSSISSRSFANDFLDAALANLAAVRDESRGVK